MNTVLKEVREAMILAENYVAVEGSESEMDKHVAALTKLNALIAAQEKAEPVAWTLTEELIKRETTTHAHLWFSNPVNCMWTPLYTSPQPAPSTSQPLTDEWIRSLCKETWVFETVKQWVSLVEAAHKIGAKP